MCTARYTRFLSDSARVSSAMLVYSVWLCELVLNWVKPWANTHIRLAFVSVAQNTRAACYLLSIGVVEPLRCMSAYLWRLTRASSEACVRCCLTWKFAMQTLGALAAIQHRSERRCVCV